MAPVFGKIKFFGAWVCIVVVCVILLLSRGSIPAPGVIALLAIAFALAPASW